MTAADLVPPSYPSSLAAGYSNCDHEWSPGLEPTALTERGGACPHAAWDHWGIIWWQDGQFHEQVWVHHVVVEVMSAGSLNALVAAVNDKYGHD